MLLSRSHRSLRNRVTTRVRNMLRDDRGVTTEQVIWIAFLAALALTVTGLFGPQILAAARSVTFK